MRGARGHPAQQAGAASPAAPAPKGRLQVSVLFCAISKTILSEYSYCSRTSFPTSAGKHGGSLGTPAVAQLPQDRSAVTGAAASADAVPFRSHTWAGLPRGRPSDPDISISLGAHGAIFFSSPSLPPDVPRTPGTRWTEAQPAVSRDTRPPEPLHCPVDICPVDIFAQRQHVWIARPTLKAIDQEQSLATVHHAIAGSLGHEIFRSPGTTCRSMRRLRDSQNTCCLMGGRASLPVAADRRRGARSGR